MNILVDTSIWSQVLRRKVPPPDNLDLQEELTELIRELRVSIIGPIRQEILSGIKTESQIKELKSFLAAFPDLQLETSDYENAAVFFNICRRNGVQGSNTDFLICSVAYRRNLEIFTSDSDFRIFEKHIPIKIYLPKTSLRKRTS